MPILNSIRNIFKQAHTQTHINRHIPTHKKETHTDTHRHYRHKYTDPHRENPGIHKCIINYSFDLFDLPEVFQWLTYEATCSAKQT